MEHWSKRGDGGHSIRILYPLLSNNINFLNNTITKMVQSYRGNLKISTADLTQNLNGSSCIPHELHLNKSGKCLISSKLAEVVMSIDGPFKVTWQSGNQSDRPSTVYQSNGCMTMKTTSNFHDTIESFPLTPGDDSSEFSPALTRRHLQGTSVFFRGHLSSSAREISHHSR